MLIEFIIPTHYRPKLLQCMLSSLCAQTDDDWVATVIVDDLYIRTDLLDILKDFDPNKIRSTFTGTRYNDFGHTPREMVKQKSTADYVIMTNDDNYYTPNLVKEIKGVVESRPGLIYWDMVHSHYNYQYFKCEPRTHQIDMGAFATRTDLAKQIKLNTGFAADGDFIEDFRKKFPLEQKTKINKVLFVHN